MAAMEIKALFDKYDIAGIAQLYTPDGAEAGMTEFVMKIDPSFSVVHLNHLKRLQITPPIVDPLNEAPAKKRIGQTVNMLANLRIHIGNLYQVFVQADATVRQHFGMMPKPGEPNGTPPKN